LGEEAQLYESLDLAKDITLDKEELKLFGSHFVFYTVSTGEFETPRQAISRKDIWEWLKASLQWNTSSENAPSMETAVGSTNTSSGRPMPQQLCHIPGWWAISSTSAGTPRI
jgi:hypothetical protein